VVTHGQQRAETEIDGQRIKTGVLTRKDNAAQISEVRTMQFVKRSCSSFMYCGVRDFPALSLSCGSAIVGCLLLALSWGFIDEPGQ